MLSSFLALSIAQTVDFVFLLRTSAISSSGAASAEAKLVWIMPSRDRARRSQAEKRAAELKLPWYAEMVPAKDGGYLAQNRNKSVEPKVPSLHECHDGYLGGAHRNRMVLLWLCGGKGHDVMKFPKDPCRSSVPDDGRPCSAR